MGEKKYSEYGINLTVRKKLKSRKIGKISFAWKVVKVICGKLIQNTLLTDFLWRQTKLRKRK